MTDREIMQQALEALENVTEDYVESRQYKHNKAITALREGLAQLAPVQEPVAWLHPANATCVTTDPTAYARGIPLYTAPPAAPVQPEQEPVYHLRQFGDVTKEQFERYAQTGSIAAPAAAQQIDEAYAVGYSNGMTEGYEAGKAYAAAQRQWVWLSTADEQEIKSNCTTVACVLRAVKEKLKEKNT